MAVKNRSSHRVDLVGGIIDGCLKQVRAVSDEQRDNDKPEFVSVWCCEIQPINTKIMVPLIRDHVLPFDHPLNHLKRYKKVQNSLNESVIHGIICTDSFQYEKEDLCQFIDKLTEGKLNYAAFKAKVPLSVPQTREISEKWGELYWPMNWKGNPNHQFLNSVKFNFEHEKMIIGKLISEVSPSTSSRLVTFFAKPDNDLKPELICISKYDGCGTPYDHSIMKCIDQIASMETSRRNSTVQGDSNYLCHNLTVYTTDEPCVMCCMALIHSRIGRIIYLKSSSKTGGLESNYQLGAREGLNWKFEIWKWIGEPELIRLETLRPHYKMVDF